MKFNPKRTKTNSPKSPPKDPKDLIGKFAVVENGLTGMLDEREQDSNMGQWKNGDVFFVTGFSDICLDVMVYGGNRTGYGCALTNMVREATVEEVEDWFYRIQQGKIFSTTKRIFENAISKK